MIVENILLPRLLSQDMIQNYCPSNGAVWTVNALLALMAMFIVAFTVSLVENRKSKKEETMNLLTPDQFEMNITISK